MLQLLCLGLQLPQRRPAWVLQHGLLGGQRQVLEQPAQVVAAAEDLVAQVPLLRFPAQSVHQLLPHGDDQLALSDEDLGRLALAEAAVEHADGFEKRPKVEPAVFGEVDFLPRVLRT